MKRSPMIVRLRNGSQAYLNGEVQLGDRGQYRFLQGSHPAAALDLWFRSGRWSACDSEHPFDIVARLEGSTLIDFTTGAYV